MLSQLGLRASESSENQAELQLAQWVQPLTTLCYVHMGTEVALYSKGHIFLVLGPPGWAPKNPKSPPNPRCGTSFQKPS